MTLRMDLSGKNFNARDPNLFEICFAATGGQFARIDTGFSDSLGESAALVIARGEPFSCALIEADPQIFLVHRCLAEPLICLTKPCANRHIIFIAAARRQIYAGMQFPGAFA